MNYIIVILTIERNKTRLNNIQTILNDQNLLFGKDYLVFYGIDYKNTDKQCLKSICKKGFKAFCPYSVLACASSHILLWKYISTLKFDYIIILEDDTYINVDIFKNYKDTIELLINDSIVFLYSDCYLMGNRKKVNNNVITESPKFHVSMGCYVLTPKTASMLYYYYIKNKIWFHIDFQLNIDVLNLGLKRFIFIKNNLCQQYQGNNSSMGLKHNNILLRPLTDTTILRIITTPIMRFENIEIDFYILAMVSVFIFIVLCHGLNYSSLFFLVFILVDLFYNT
jgi:GR25 family glycosyltransferase involved in LPS biosynthesis